MARGRGSGKKSGSKPTSKARSDKQNLKDRYAHAREDAQLAGLIPTTPEDALKSEVVPSTSQEEVAQPGLIEEAIRKGWDIPEQRKPGLVDELIGMVDNPEVAHKVKVAAFSALLRADQQQYERDHPTTTKPGATIGGTMIGQVNIVQSNLDAAAIVREMVARGELGCLEEVRAPAVTGAPGSGGLGGEVEGCAAPEGNQQCAGDSVAHPE